jgi:hypothetical protein
LILWTEPIVGVDEVEVLLGFRAGIARMSNISTDFASRPRRKTCNSLARLTRSLMARLELNSFKILINKPARYSSVS